MPNLLQFPRYLYFKGQQEIWDDFTADQDAAEWVKTGDASSTNTVGDAVGGILAITPGAATDNDEAYVESPNETFKVAAGKPILFEALIQFAEANVDDANIIAGLMSAVGANSLVDNGAGPQATFDGAVIYKVDGGTVWRAKSSVGTTATDTVSTTTAGGAAYQTLRIEWHDYSATQMQITYFVNDIQLVDANNVPIKHLVNVASATEIQIVLGVKNGGTNIETLNVDYVYAGQLR